MSIRPNYIPKILIIDDEPFNLEFLEIVLRQKGYNILTATNGRDGRNLAEKELPDLILLDIMMPGENGFECATVLRLSPETSEIPIIFLTALDDAKNTTKGYDAGAVDFIIKPFEYKDVIHSIRLHLKISESEKQLLRSGSTDILTSPAPNRSSDILLEKGARSTYPDEPVQSGSFIYEMVILSNKSEAHLLLNFSPPVADHEIHQKVQIMLAENTGPLFTTSETLRNVGFKLKSIIGDQSKIFGAFASIDRETDKLTVANAGDHALIFQKQRREPTLIERQSADLGTLGRGIMPCATYEMKKGDRLFMFSRGMLASFNSRFEAISELKEACELSAGVDIDTACQAAAEMLQRNNEKLDGILVAIEG
ncbi:response regulator [Maridesulfovibrio hydrothermalis]|uniref:Response regulator receiver protein n=1 Tax=Maridesulfovibrio hydrothermalis AM13 = DSM 14728 TaxID=1121451 RepID=L0R902_9BACT|nr:response regulator [Maridesulfovibrio hydrothermalis]CCO22702.1 Response regulator receiver protein [Maridesulfovibrio hydrothermalis AM13 = DSM 14728]